MGILNVTPDSFSGDGILVSGSDPVKSALRRARLMLKAGAAIIDVGGESTRPGSDAVDTTEELARVVPVVRALVPSGCLVSVDTSKPDVAAAALEAGAHILNVVKGTPVSERLLRLVKKYDAGLVLMHIRGVPRTMQQHVRYRRFPDDIVTELGKSVAKCVAFGLNKNALVVDPGFGFAKTMEQNLVLLRELKTLARLGCPVLVGTSRKSFIGKVLGADARNRLWGTAATTVCAIMEGAHMVRVHDVVAIKQVARMTDAVLNMENKKT